MIVKSQRISQNYLCSVSVAVHVNTIYTSNNH